MNYIELMRSEFVARYPHSNSTAISDADARKDARIAFLEAVVESQNGIIAELEAIRGPSPTPAAPSVADIISLAMSAPSNIPDHYARR